jgi:putative transposase
MKTSKFSESQIINILKLAENGMSITEVCRSNGISSATFYKWRAKYGGMDVSMLSQVKQLEAENNRLKKMYAELQLDHHILKEAMKKSGKAITT